MILIFCAVQYQCQHQVSEQTPDFEHPALDALGAQGKMQPKIRKESVEGVWDGYCSRPRPMFLPHDRERDEQAVGLGSGQLSWSNDTSFACLGPRLLI